MEGRGCGLTTVEKCPGVRTEGTTGRLDEDSDGVTVREDGKVERGEKERKRIYYREGGGIFIASY